MVFTGFTGLDLPRCDTRWSQANPHSSAKLLGVEWEYGRHWPVQNVHFKHVHFVGLLKSPMSSMYEAKFRPQVCLLAPHVTLISTVLYDLIQPSVLWVEINPCLPFNLDDICDSGPSISQLDIFIWKLNTCCNQPWQGNYSRFCIMMVEHFPLPYLIVKGQLKPRTSDSDILVGIVWCPHSY